MDDDGTAPAADVPPAPDAMSQACPSREVLEAVAAKWTPLVLRALQDGPHRFGELRAAVDGISDRLLAQRLRTLEHDGWVRREVPDGTASHATYALTCPGARLAAHVAALVGFVEESLPAVLSARAAHAER